ncbi:MAG TPA: VOC family protein [Dongiaceae bacterium]|jgi:predicted lactoylglutathione lyase|nr:VOC family protein [Dongiaceae bacterium]
MYDHVGLHVKDLKASVRFYEAALAGLGHVLCSQDASGAGFGPEGAAALWLYADKGTKSPGVHIAFRAKNRAAVDQFYKDGVKAGGGDNGKPGLRADYSPTYYAAFLTDPDGNNVEAVCLK